MSRFHHLGTYPSMENMALSRLFKEDTSSSKIDLGIEVNNNDYGLEIVFPVVQEAQKAIVSDPDYLVVLSPLLGLDCFVEASTTFILGEDSNALEEERAFGVQVLGGGGGLRLVCEFLVKAFSYKYIYVSDPSPVSQKILITHAGLECRQYRYWSRKKKCLDLKGMLEDLQNAPSQTIILFQAAGHNPTGCDPTREQWKTILEVVEANGLFPVFHLSFLGLISGNFENDLWPIRYCVWKRLCLASVVTFSKIMGLSNERVGNMIIVTTDSYSCDVSKSKLCTYTRAMYSSPPAYGAFVVNSVLRDKRLFLSWKASIEAIHAHLVNMRKLLRESLEELNTPGDWSHITSQRGVFSLSGLNERQCFYIFQKYHIYIPLSGRISICAVSTENVKYIAEAINNAVTTVR